MSNIQLSTPVYIAGAIVGFVLIVVSLAVLLVRPADVAQMAQNNAVQSVQPQRFYTGMDGGYILVTPTPIPITSDYVVVVK